MQRARLPYLLIPVAAFLAIIPLIITGCSCGHDFDFHILSWFEAARQFSHGNLHPHWAYTPAYNAGEPRFVFYPPLSWTAGAILGLLLPWTWTPIVYTWLALTGSGLALYRLARDFTTSTAALIAAVLYMANPYMLFTAYERTAFAELLAAAWIPLLLHAILRGNDKGGVTIPRIAIPIALLWLTNAPAAVMSCYALALLTIIRLAANPSNEVQRESSKNWIAPNLGAPSSARPLRLSRGPRQFTGGVVRWASRASATASDHDNTAKTSPQTPLQIALTTLTGTALGLGLAAFYILPAAYQRRYVQIAMAIIPDMRIQDNFLFHHTGEALHDQVLHTASLIAIILITLTVAALLIARRAMKPGAPYLDSEMWASRNGATAPAHFNQRQQIYSLAILTLAITLLLTPLTQFIWTHAPELVFLQFPWRLLAILGAVLALAIALALPPLKLKPVQTAILTLFLIAALTYPAYTVFHQTCDEEDTVQSRVALFHSNQGADPTDEYTPTTADNDSLAHSNPPWWLSPDPNAKAPTNTQPGPAPTHFSFRAIQPGFLILNLRDYPSWEITNTAPNSMHLNHPNHIQRDDGLIAVPLYYAADFTIDITYNQTLDQTLGDALSLASLALLAFLLFAGRRKNLI